MVFTRGIEVYNPCIIYNASYTLKNGLFAHRERNHSASPARFDFVNGFTPQLHAPPKAYSPIGLIPRGRERPFP